MSSFGQLTWLIHFSAGQRLATALGIALAAFLAQPNWISTHTRVLVSWNLGVLIYLGLAWALVARSDAKMTHDHALSQDQSGYVIFLFVVSAACAGIVAIGFIVSTLKGLAFWPKAWHLALSIAALISSWLLIQIVFAFHYARRYYENHRRGKTSESGGLSFPGQQAPDYLDFAYYSFVVGMTSQVSDITTTTRSMRRLTLIHGVLAFIFNIAIVAMSINIIASVI